MLSKLLPVHLSICCREVAVLRKTGGANPAFTTAVTILIPRIAC